LKGQGDYTKSTKTGTRNGHASVHDLARVEKSEFALASSGTFVALLAAKFQGRKPRRTSNFCFAATKEQIMFPKGDVVLFSN